MHSALGQDRECYPLVAFVFCLFPDTREHKGFSVFAAEIVRLLSVFLAPFVKAVGRYHTTLLFEVRAELPFAESVGARIEQRRPWLATRANSVDPEPRNNHAITRDQHGHSFSRRDIRVEFKIHPLPAVELTRDLGPFLNRAEAIAHAIKVAQSHYVNQASDLTEGSGSLMACNRCSDRSARDPRTPRAANASSNLVRALLQPQSLKISESRLTARGALCPIG